MLVLAAVPAAQFHKLRRAAAPPRRGDRRPGVPAPLPSDLGGGGEGVPRPPAELQTVQQVAARARVDRRTFERWFARLGLPSPRHFLAAARVLYAHRLLQDPGFTIDDVAQRLGYAQTKTLQLHARSYLGRTAIMSGDAEADNVRAWLQHNPCTVLKKPFDLRQIVDWAHELLDVTDRRSGNG